MYGVAKFFNLCIWSIENYYAICSSKQFAISVTYIYPNVVNNTLCIINFIYGKLQSDSTMSTQHLGEPCPKFIVFYVVTDYNHIVNLGYCELFLLPIKQR